MPFQDFSFTTKYIKNAVLWAKIVYTKSKVCLLRCICFKHHNTFDDDLQNFNRFKFFTIYFHIFWEFHPKVCRQWSPRGRRVGPYLESAPQSPASSAPFVSCSTFHCSLTWQCVLQLKWEANLIGKYWIIWENKIGWRQITRPRLDPNPHHNGKQN